MFIQSSEQREVTCLLGKYRAFHTHYRGQILLPGWLWRHGGRVKRRRRLQINLEKTHVITAIETQGRFGNGTGREYATEYMVDYLRPGSKWIRYKNRTGHTVIFILFPSRTTFQYMSANLDTTTAVFRALDPPITASRLRIVPHSKSTRTVCLRAEIYGCPQKGTPPFL